MNHEDPERPSTFRQFLALERPRFPKWLWLGVVVLAVGMLVLVGVGVHDLRQYRSGTPVVATIVKCQSSGKGNQSECTVRWYEDGKAHTAQLHRVDGHPLVGSRVDVGVKGDDAYAATSGRTGLIGGSIGIGVILAVSAYVLLNRRRKRQREYS